jgi:hypothetical protein
VPVGNEMRWVEARHALKPVLVVGCAPLTGGGYTLESDHKFRVEGFYRNASAKLHHNTIKRVI